MDDHEYMYGHTYCINGQITFNGHKLTGIPRAYGSTGL